MKVCRMRVSSMVAGLMVLVLTTTPVLAGEYEVEYSGGTLTSYSNDGQVFSQGYSLHDGGATYGVAYSYADWGTRTLPDGTVVAASGSVTCQGVITATFTWVPSPYIGADDEPPKAVVIAEASESKWDGDGSGAAAPTGSSSNGLGFPEVTPPPGSPGAGKSGVSQGTRYQIKQDPGESFTITCSPGASVSGTGAVGPPELTGNGHTEMRYSASAQPLQVVLSGGIGPQSNKRYLIGQRISATVETGGLTATSYDWQEGEASFESYTTSNTSGVLKYLDRPILSSNVAWYVSEPVPDNSAECQVHLAVPPGAKPAAGLDADLIRDYTVQAPEFDLHADIGSVQGISQPYNGIGLAGGTPGSFYVPPYLQDEGIYYWGDVTTPDEHVPVAFDYTPIYGDWGFTQLGVIKRSEKHEVSPNNFVMKYNSLYGIRGLDGQVFWRTSYAPYTANGSLNWDHDTPAHPVGSPVVRVSVADGFFTYMMYRPPGDDSTYVPLQYLDWFWAGEALFSSSGWTIANADAGWSLLQTYPLHPEWSCNTTGQQQQMVTNP